MKNYLKLNNELLNTFKNSGYIDRDKDKEATRQYFLEEVNVRLRYFIDLDEKLKYLTSEGYYEKEFLEMYDFKFIKKLFKKVYAYNFRFPSFMSASKFYESYAMKSRDDKEILEKYEDRVAIIALYLAQGNEDLALKAVDAIMTAYQPATPTALNSGKKARGELVSCFPYDTKVKTINGEVNIGEISVDDLVLTHNGHYKKVTGVKVSNYKDELVTIKTIGNQIPITSTKEHPFLIYRANQSANSINPVLRGDGETHNLKWIQSKDIVKGDMIIRAFEKLQSKVNSINIYDYLSEEVKERVLLVDDYIYLETVDNKNNKLKENNYDMKSNKVKNNVKLDEDFGRYIGYYLSEGYIHKSNDKIKGIRFTFNKNFKLIQEDTIKLSNDLFGIEASFNENNDGSVNVCSWSLILGDFFNNIIGSGFDNKLIKNNLWKLLNKNVIKGILLGTFRGDGTIGKNLAVLDLTNPNLIKQLETLAFNIGLTVYHGNYTSNSGKVTGRLTIPFSNYDNLEFAKLIGRGNINSKQLFTNKKNTWIDGYPAFKVSEITTSTEDLTVYNLEVEDDHTYTAEGVIVHNCFKIGMDDSMNSIAENIGYALELSRLGGGVGISLTDLRPLGDPIKGIENRASGIIPVAKLLENSFSYSNQMGQRQGSGVVYLNLFHPDIESFISAKKPNADDKIRLATLSTAVIIPDIFFKLMKNDKDVVLFSPYDIYKEYGKRMSEISITEMYYELLDNPKIRKIKRLNARKLYTEIKKAQFESGYPFEMFDDTVNNEHPLKDLGRVKMSNLC